MDLKNLFALFISILMVGSIVGFTAFYNFPDQSSGTGDGSDITQPPTAIDFQAEGVEASIFQMLPSMTIQAETPKTELVAVNNSVYGIDGMKRVNGKFDFAPYTVLGTGFVYIADISFDNDLNSEYILEKLREETSLQSITGNSFALIELPQTVSMHSLSAELDLTREYTFSENISEAIVSLDSIEGDSLEVSFVATFIGEQATNLMAFEERNLTAEPIPKKAELEVEIASLEPTLLSDAALPYTMVDEISLLEQDINALEPVTGAELFASNPKPILFLESDANLSEVEFAGLKAYLEDLNAESVLLENSPLNGSLSFSETISSQLFSEKKFLVGTVLQGLAISYVVVEQEGLLSAEVSLVSPEASEAEGLLAQLFESRELEAEIRQPAELALQEIFDADLNKSHIVPDANISGLLLTGHVAGETVSVEVDYWLVRGLIDLIAAEESS